MSEPANSPRRAFSASRRPDVRPTPPALEANTVRLVLIGLVLWAVAFVVLLVVHRDADWLWTCVAGFLLGLLGLQLARRARR